jgi:hypothetical protein
MVLPNMQEMPLQDYLWNVLNRTGKSHLDMDNTYQNLKIERLISLSTRRGYGKSILSSKKKAFRKPENKMLDGFLKELYYCSLII